MCNNCEENRRANRDKLRPPRASGLHLPGAERPTVAGLERHARRFGGAMVAETAAQYGLSVVIVEPEKKPKRKKVAW